MTSPKYSGKRRRRKLLVVRQIHGRSMMPFLNPGQIVVGHGFFRVLKPNDIVIFWHEEREKIKRISHLRDGMMFVIGDNTNASMDSRHFGEVPVHTIIAKVIS